MKSLERVNKPGIKELISHRSYIIMVIANLISRFGDSVDSIAYAWMVYTLTGSKLLLGTLFAVNAIPGIILSPFTGVLVDYLPKKSVVIIGDMGRGLVVFITALLYYFNVLEPWHLFIFTFINSTLETFVNNARFSLIPSLLTDEIMMAGTSFLSSASSFAELVGTGLAGALIGFMGVSGAIFIDGVTFFLSSLIILTVKVVENKAEGLNISLKGYFQDLRKGFIYVIEDKLIFISIILISFVNFCFAPVNILMPAFSEEVLKAGANGLSLMSVGFSIGMISGGIVITQIGERVKKGKLFIGGLAAMAISYALLGTVSHQSILSPVIMAVLLFFSLGLFLPFANSPLRAHVMIKTPRNILSRVGSIVGMFSLSAIPLGGFLTGIISTSLTINTIFISMGTVMIFASLIPLLNKDFRNA